MITTTLFLPLMMTAACFGIQVQDNTFVDSCGQPTTVLGAGSPELILTKLWLLDDMYSMDLNAAYVVFDNITDPYYPNSEIFNYPLLDTWATVIKQDLNFYWLLHLYEEENVPLFIDTDYIATMVSILDAPNVIWVYSEEVDRRLTPPQLNDANSYLKTITNQPVCVHNWAQNIPFIHNYYNSGDCFTWQAIDYDRVRHIGDLPPHPYIISEPPDIHEYGWPDITGNYMVYDKPHDNGDDVIHWLGYR